MHIVTFLFCRASLPAYVLLGLLFNIGHYAPVSAQPVAAAPLSNHDPVRSYEKFHRGYWRLDITRNVFAGGIACRLRTRGGQAIYRMWAVGFRYPARWDVSSASFRIDVGPLYRVRDALPDLIARGAPVDRGQIDNASAGIVWVPYEALVRAESITIQPRPDKRAHVRHFGGLVELHDLAIAHGCVPESSFVE